MRGIPETRYAHLIGYVIVADYMKGSDSYYIQVIV